jgi:glycosyltransferase involved in cell wall biosynthesis
MKSPHRILITQKFASLGGGQASLVHHLELLDRGRFEPLVVVSNTGWFTSRLDDLGISWTQLAFGHWTNPFSIPRNIALIFKLRRFIKAERIELVHANEHWVGPVSYFAARLANVPVICHFRTGLRDLTPGRIRKYLYSRYDKVIAVAEVLARALKKHVSNPSNIVVIRDGVVPAAAEPRYRKNNSRSVVINVGAIYQVKGQALILEAAMPWLKSNPRNYLIFVGGTREDPAYFEAMKRRVEQSALSRQVRFLGPRRDVPRLVQMADALVAYSSVEGIPMVVMEAMFAGRPVIVSDTPGMSEVVIDREVGRLIDFSDGGRELPGVLEDLRSNPAHWQALGRRAREHSITRYSTAAMSNAIQAIYSELLETERHARSEA